MSHPMFRTLRTPVPAIEPAFASELLRTRYGVDGRLVPLPSERDLNFLVEVEYGRRYVLKFANAAEDAGVTDFQNRALMHLAARDPGFRAPRVMT
ncbi:MAG: hypothetical protein AAFX10_13185, partial [Pseudomonadota bacterium]